jgi:hypothetical protein
MLRRVAEWINNTLRGSNQEWKLRWVQSHLMV